MSTPRGNCLTGQSGGPTAVINASLCGVIQEAMRHSEIEGIYGARHGILGVLHEDLIDMRQEDPDEIEFLKSTPAAALGSIRHKLPDPSQDSSEYERILQIFEAHNIRYFFYAGGNDSMDTVNKIAAHAAGVGYHLGLVRPRPARRSGAVSRRPRARRARPQDATHPDGSGGTRRHALRLPHRPG